MPLPVSLTANITYGPGLTSAWVRAYPSSSCTLWGYKGQFAAMGHGIASVSRQIHQHVLDLTGIGFDWP